MTDTLVNFRTRLLAIPAKLSPILAKKKDQTEIFKLMKAAIDETLEELYGDLVVDDKIFEFQIQILENEIGGSAHCG